MLRFSAFRANFVAFLAIFVLFSEISTTEARVAIQSITNITSNVIKSECKIDINNDITEPQPLFLLPGTEEFFLPGSDGVIKIASGQDIELFCSRSFASPLGGQKVIATCLEGDAFLVDGAEYFLEEFSCTSNAAHVARRTGKTCHVDATLIEVGFEVGDRFLPNFDICHDERAEATLYVHHKLTPANNGYQKSVARVNFIPGEFYQGKDVNTLYTKKIQMDTIGEILGGDHEQYFDDKKSFFLARGHLAAKTDVIFGSQQRGTFYFVNAAPQWQRFNAGNWERVENSVRKFVADNNMVVDCYTGTHGIMELPDINGVPQPLYLAFDENNNGLIPVPKIYFRVVVEPATKRGIVLIGVNNPHLTYEQIAREYIFCEDISDIITWINWKRDDISSGYSYACEVNQFKEAVKHVPDVDVTGILF